MSLQRVTFVLWNLARVACAASVVIVLATPLEATSFKLVKVDCAKGERINQALENQADELIVEFSGVCEEDVLIEGNNVTLRGTGASPAIVGAPGVPAPQRQPALALRHAANTVLTGFSVEDIDSRGVEMIGSTATIDGITVSDSRAGLLLLESSAAFVRNSSFSGNTGDGIGVWENSTLVLEGSIDASSNSRVGLLLSNGSSATVRSGAQVTANDNLVGIALQLNASAQIAAFLPTSSTASGNASVGISLLGLSHWTGSASVSGSEFCVAVESGSDFSGTLSANACSVGLYGDKNSTLRVQSGALSGNDVGVWLDSATALFSASSIQANVSADVQLEFGARLSAFDGTTAGTVTCDDTVLTRGSVSCPPAASSDKAGFRGPYSRQSGRGPGKVFLIEE